MTLKMGESMRGPFVFVVGIFLRVTDCDEKMKRWKRPGDAASPTPSGLPGACLPVRLFLV